MADDYFAAMERVERRLDIVPEPESNDEVVKVQKPEKMFRLIERLKLPELRFEERLDIASQLRGALGLQ